MPPQTGAQWGPGAQAGSAVLIQSVQEEQETRQTCVHSLHKHFCCSPGVKYQCPVELPY